MPPERLSSEAYFARLRAADDTCQGPPMQVYDDDTAERLTLTAIEVGYRNFFASVPQIRSGRASDGRFPRSGNEAVLAGNQKGFARAIEKSGVPRDEFFICGSVLSNLAQDFEDAYLSTKEGCTKNLEAFAAGGITELDMILLDYPAKDCETIRGQWKAFEEMLAAGQTKSLAVSNFSPEQLDCILANPDATRPVLNQLPYSLKNYDTKVVQDNAKRTVAAEKSTSKHTVAAAAPFLSHFTGGVHATGSGWNHRGYRVHKPMRSIDKPQKQKLPGADALNWQEIGIKYGKTAAQVALNFG
ncbi:unnamed protein product [Durusdinium trenchii]|uniref:NADP-dependent oxidoreductase domain-containing protein n=1 Tax=Durusdinium trenchii TaxID=1381693 RepID=A0ABP0Q757_9DINO